MRPKMQDLGPDLVRTKEDQGAVAKALDNHVLAKVVLGDRAQVW